jgi:hypothetical protein
MPGKRRITTRVAEPQPKPGGFWSGWTAFAAGLAALVTAAGGLLGGLAAAGVIGGSDEAGQSPGPAAATTTKTEPEKTFVTFNATPDEKRLLRVVAADIQPSCQRPNGPETGLPSAVILFCYDPALVGEGYVRFALFDSTAALERYMSERRSLGKVGERCGTKPSGSGTYRGADDEPMGELICYVDKEGAWLEWTNLRADVYGLAYEPNSDWRALYDFWARVGPTSS